MITDSAFLHSWSVEELKMALEAGSEALSNRQKQKRSKPKLTYCVYIHTCPDGQSYVGITSLDPELRWNHGHGYTGSWFETGINKWGWDNIEHEIVAIGLDEHKAKALEFNLIDSLHTWCPGIGYNNAFPSASSNKPLPVRDPVTHKVYSSVSQACKYTGKSADWIKKRFEFCNKDNISSNDIYMPYIR